jgi:hypothetical protein
MLARLQQHLADIYQADSGVDVRDFLITDPALAHVLGQEKLIPNTDESVLVAQDDDGLALSVYLNEAMIERLESADPLINLHADRLNDFWTVLEGISHFNYIAWRASADRSVTLLELEIQAEVDKFVSTLLLALEQRDGELVTRLHGLLFDKAQFRPELDAQQYERYRAANEYAARFCRALRQRLIDGNNRVMSELRRFYRLSQTEKISHIHSQAWSVT